MKISKPVAVASATAIIGLATLGSVAAQAADSAKTDPMNNLVQAIATKFNLNQSDVQQVFDAQREKMETERQATEKTRLDQAVTEGKITQEQEDKIIAKRAELKTAMENNRTAMQSMTDEERKAAMEKQRSELKQWASDNNIPEQYLIMMGGHGGPGEPGGRGGFHGERPAITTQDS